MTDTPEYIIEGAGFRTVKFDDMPLNMGGAEVTELRIREPKVSDHLAVDKIASAALKEVAILANLCEVSPDEISGLSIKQYGRLQEAYLGFLA